MRPMKFVDDALRVVFEPFFCLQAHPNLFHVFLSSLEFFSCLRQHRHRIHCNLRLALDGTLGKLLAWLTL